MKKNKISISNQKKLSAMRVQIDQADLQMLMALGSRFKAVNQVGIVKAKERMPLYQKARWDEVVQNRLKVAKKVKLDERFVRSLLKLIHREAIRIQKTKRNKK